MTRRPPPADPLHKATLTFRQHGVGVELEVLEGVFAAAGVDTGTKQLLRRLAEERFAPARRVLDVGCGYGPLALWLAAQDRDREVLAVDRDARAVLATALGATSNRLPAVHAIGSLGFDDVGARPFDLVVSNIPAKVGAAALTHLLLDAAHRLTDGGLVATVVIARLVDDVARVLADPAVEVVATYPTRTYTVFVHRFSALPADSAGGSGFERGLYRRGHAQFAVGPARWTADVAHSIGEFDQLGHGTVAAVTALPTTATATTVVVAGVGQGHLPLALRASGSTAALRLVDRDLLALRQSHANLDGDAELRHQPRLLPDDLVDADLAVVALDEREPVAVTAACLGAALDGYDRRVLLHGRTADVQRVLELLPRSGTRLVAERTERQRSHTAVLAHRR